MAHPDGKLTPRSACPSLRAQAQAVTSPPVLRGAARPRWVWAPLETHQPPPSLLSVSGSAAGRGEAQNQYEKEES